MRQLLAAVVLLGACASSTNRAGPPTAPPAEEPNVGVEQLFAELRGHDIEFSNVLLEDDPFRGCKRMLELRDSICALANRICLIAEKEPPGSQAAGYCSDGKLRCKNAVERIAGRGCALGPPR